MNDQNSFFYLPPQPTPAIEEEFSLLMSLGLDDLLDGAERQRFDAYLARYSVFAEQWRAWQQLHQKLCATPHVEPPIGFAAKVELRLVHQDRQKRLWQGTLFGLFLMSIWVGLALVATGLGAFLLFNQSNLLGGLIQNLAYLSSLAASWGASLRGGAATLVGTPQTIALCLGYVGLAVILLSGWFRFLRQTTVDAEPISVGS
jgi:hypothetical protein